MPVSAVDVRLWGKSRGLTRSYPVICHLLDTAAAAGALWDMTLTDEAKAQVARRLGVSVEVCRQWLCLWAGLHDIGKISPPFQAMVPEAYKVLADNPAYVHKPGAERERLRHDVAGHWALTQILADWNYPQASPPSRSPHHQVAQLLGGHHGCFHRALEAKHLKNLEGWMPELGGPGWAAQRREHAEAVRHLVGGDGGVPALERALPADVAVRFLGMIVVADWLVSQESLIEARLPGEGWEAGEGELQRHWDIAVSQARSVVAAARLGVARFPARGFGEQFPFAPNALQASVAEDLPGLTAGGGGGLLLVTAPTGDGKTETALHAASVMARASGAGGLYFALPTMATADAMFGRVAGFAESNVDGARALTLLHSMAWLSDAYGQAATTLGSAVDGGLGATVSDAHTSTDAGRWLRGAKRGLLAPLGAGTIDQALTGVLPVRYNALRLLGLSNKVFVVDEAHAYGPWMHSLLVRLLEWLGAMGTPVVLLSATLAGRAATSLVEAYRRGCGFKDSVAVEPVYPGWLYVDAGTGAVSTPRPVASGRPRTVRLHVESVAWDTSLRGADPVGDGTRSAALARHLEPVVTDGGCALVCCTTVAEAQRTYRLLQARFPELAAEPDGLMLLHSRFPAQRRKEITDVCEVAFGKPSSDDAPGRRPRRAILVATQVVEQSLDLDFDLVVSDLAPLAQLLQRAGRCMRHEREGRPAWVGRDPRLVVLEPTADGQVAVPRTWGTVYDVALLRRTSMLLRESQTTGIAVPGDVQRLVDAVYAEDFADRLPAAAAAELRRQDAEREASELAEKQLATMTAVPPPTGLVNLAKLTDAGLGLLDEALVTTRLGADSERAVCLYRQPGGEWTLDQEGEIPVPAADGAGDRTRLDRGDVRVVMRQTVPVPGRWLAQSGPDQNVPAGWADQPVLSDLVALRMSPTAQQLLDGDPADISWSCRVGDHTLTMSDIGLRRS
ncbi:CRISPR-associated endonuclease Cas3'' [Streptomyces sp. NBC_00873]|uniref:CRISPR-associated endonuclease Cas3'' n=1 Tax=Streptomyces sp. NBC_00873 TaxID=2975852 RepID=UPI00386816F9|nr:CRISPR-associated endonuclease Cas3'' [Streptomyces sp. NBC_00873]